MVCVVSLLACRDCLVLLALLFLQTSYVLPIGDSTIFGGSHTRLLWWEFLLLRLTTWSSST